MMIAWEMNHLMILKELMLWPISRNVLNYCHTLPLRTKQPQDLNSSKLGIDMVISKVTPPIEIPYQKMVNKKEKDSTPQWSFLKRLRPRQIKRSLDKRY